MKAGILYADREMRMGDAPDPTLGPDDVLIQPGFTREDPVERVCEITKGVGVDCVIECIGDYHAVDGQEAPMAQAVKMMRNGGRIVTTGLGEWLSAIHFKTLVMKEGEIIASRCTLDEFPRATRLLERVCCTLN